MSFQCFMASLYSLSPTKHNLTQGYLKTINNCCLLTNRGIHFKSNSITYAPATDLEQSTSYLHSPLSQWFLSWNLVGPPHQPSCHKPEWKRYSNQINSLLADTVHTLPKPVRRADSDILIPFPSTNYHHFCVYHLSGISSELANTAFNSPKASTPIQMPHKIFIHSFIQFVRIQIHRESSTPITSQILRFDCTRNTIRVSVWEGGGREGNNEPFPINQYNQQSIIYSEWGIVSIRTKIRSAVHCP